MRALQVALTARGDRQYFGTLTSASVIVIVFFLIAVAVVVVVDTWLYNF